MRKPLFVILIFVLGFMSMVARPSASRETAVAVASQHEAFAAALMLRPGWQAAAYNSYNAYGVWRVQFWDVEGNELGWADVSPELRRVYNWEIDYTATTVQVDTAKPILWAFLETEPEITSLVGDLNRFPIDASTFEYDFENHWWAVTIPRALNSIVVYIKFDGDSPLLFDNPRIVRIAFPHILSYEEWYDNARDQAITTAFTHAEIGDLLRDVEWEGNATQVSLGDTATWLVNFDVEEKTMISAMVNIDDGTVLTFAVLP